MPAVWRHRIGWKLLALACAAMYVKPFALGVLLPVQVGLLLFLEFILGFLWLASLFSYAFNVDRLPHRLWQLVAVPSGAIKADSLVSFLGYRATRLVVLDLNVAGWALTLAEMAVGTAFAVATMVPVIRLARFRMTKPGADQLATTIS